MKRKNWQEPYLKVLTSKWVTFPLLLILGFASGFLCASYGWVKSGYQFLPLEIIVKPPPPNTIACFPDMSFFGALDLQKELTTQMNETHMRHYNDSIVQRSLNVCMASNDGRFSLRILHVSPKQFQVISTETGGFTPYSHHTLVTESGCYKLYPIPKRLSSDYDSLIQKRQKRQAKL